MWVKESDSLGVVFRSYIALKEYVEREVLEQRRLFLSKIKEGDGGGIEK